MRVSRRVKSASGTSGNIIQREWGTHHVGIVRVYAHICERIETTHGPESQMAVQLCEWVMRVLTGLHLGQGRRSGSRRGSVPSGPSSALHHMNRVAGLYLVV